MGSGFDFKLAKGTSLLLKKWDVDDPAIRLAELNAYKSIQYHGGCRGIRRFYGFVIHTVRSSESYDWFVMEWMDAKTVHQWLMDTQHAGQPVPKTKAEIKNFFTQLIDSLLFLNGVGYHHNDLKPENVFINDQVVPPKIILHDFDNVRPLNMQITATEETTGFLYSPEECALSGSCGDAAADTRFLQIIKQTNLKSLRNLNNQIVNSHPTYAANDVFQLGILFLAVVQGSAGTVSAGPFDVALNPLSGPGVANPSKLEQYIRDALAERDKDACFRLLLTCRSTAFIPPYPKVVDLWASYSALQIPDALKSMLLYDPAGRSTLQQIQQAVAVW